MKKSHLVEIDARPIGERIAEVRAGLGMRAEDMAKALEISRGYLSEVENGRVPGKKLLSALRRMVGHLADWIETGEGELHWHGVPIKGLVKIEVHHSNGQLVYTVRPGLPLKNELQPADSEQSSPGSEAALVRDRTAIYDPQSGSGGMLLGSTGLVAAPSNAVRPALIEWTSASEAPLVLPVLFADSHTTREFQVIPQYRDASAGRGLGTVADRDMNEAGVLAFDKSWMLDTFGRADGLATVRVHGDSMEPTLADGETIVIDTHVSKVDTSGVYVIKVGDNVLVKRVQHKLDGTLVIKSDNPQYEPELIRPGSMRVHIAGRMVWPKMR